MVAKHYVPKIRCSSRTNFLLGGASNSCRCLDQSLLRLGRDVASVLYDFGYGIWIAYHYYPELDNLAQMRGVSSDHDLHPVDLLKMLSV